LVRQRARDIIMAGVASDFALPQSPSAAFFLSIGITMGLPKLLNVTVVACVAISWITGVAGVRVARAETVSDWQQGFNNKARLVAARAPDGKLYAGLEIEMPKGWKTYWRQPGEAGGVPPEFKFGASENLASARVLYPAPHRLVDKAGATIGYKDRVVFPILLEPKDAGQPIALRLEASYGVCEKLCVPAETSLMLQVPSDPGPSTTLTAALVRVPGAARDGIDPVLVSGRLVDEGGKPRIVLEVASQSPVNLDAFVDMSDGTYLPLPVRTATNGRSVAFSVDLTDGVDVKDVKGKTVAVTLVDGSGQSETQWKAE
jgi:DsbC/DsbD-like thiol-disulfide interchange protein